MAVATLKFIRRRIDSKQKMGFVLGGLKKSRKTPFVGDVYIGLFFVIELVQDRETKEPLQVELMKINKFIADD
jgi:adenosylmethionine-8-amino-7-oxononanoate aminotransferase